MAYNAKTHFGWVPENRMTRRQRMAHGLFVDQMPTKPDFKIAAGGSDKPPEMVLLYKAFRPLGIAPQSCWQSSGSCVGASAGSVIHLRQAIDITMLGDAERWTRCCWLLQYGLGRMLGGFKDPGEGSFGSAQAKAAVQFGTLAADIEGLPSFRQHGDWMKYSREDEIKWSDGDEIDDKYLNIAKKQTVIETPNVKSIDDAVRVLWSLNPLTIASSFGTRNEDIRPQGPAGMRVNIAKRRGDWAHQMMIDSYWIHPTVGLIFHVMNNWGHDAHPLPVDDTPSGGFWIVERDLEDILNERYSEVIGYGGINGFEVPAIDFSLWSLSA